MPERGSRGAPKAPSRRPATSRLRLSARRFLSVGGGAGDRPPRRSHDFACRRPHLVVLVAHEVPSDPLRIDYHDRGMRHGHVALLVENSIGAEGLALGVEEKLILDSLTIAKGAEALGIIARNRPNRHPEFVEFSENRLQLHELRTTVRSPSAAEEDQNRRAVTLRESFDRVSQGREGEVGHHRTDFQRRSRCRAGRHEKKASRKNELESMASHLEEFVL